MNRALFRLSLACLAMFVLLLLNVNYVQAFQASSLASRPGNIRTFDQQFQYQRGSIIAAGDQARGGQNVKIAESVPAKGSITGNTIYQRHYPAGPEYAPVTGYDSIFGKTGIEAAEGKYLTGTAPSLTVHNLIGLLTGKPKQGANVYLTISAKAQQAAYQALLNDGGHDAAAVAINPTTGAILAMASVPTYDPNKYTTLDGATLNKIDRRYRQDPAQPLLNRAINATYPPGSSFKVVTSSAAFSTGKVANVDTFVNAPQPLTLPNGHQLSNDAGEICGNGHPPVIQAFWLSCNTAFGQIGINLGGATLRNYATRFGWNSSNLTIPMPVSPSVVPLVTDRSLTAYTAIGQLSDAVTPLQEAMDAAAIANGGKLMKPYLVQSVQAPDLSTIQSTSPSVLSQSVSPQVANQVTQMMIAVTQNPAGTAYQTAGFPTLGNSIVIAGKTGTAENGANSANLNDAVFTCFAPASNPTIAVGVIVKGGGFGADAAAPIAVKIIKAYLGIH
jgi:peptidoglycan glycosyltransferase